MENKMEHEMETWIFNSSIVLGIVKAPELKGQNQKLPYFSGFRAIRN